MRLRIVRACHFSCGYAFKIESLKPKENQKIYGDLANHDGFGRNFRVEVSLSGEIDPLSGMIVNLADIDLWLSSVKRTLDHRFLNTDVEYFKLIIPTPENILKYFFTEFQKQIDHNKSVKLINVRLFEGENRWLDLGDHSFWKDEKACILLEGTGQKIMAAATTEMKSEPTGAKATTTTNTKKTIKK